MAQLVAGSGGWLIDRLLKGDPAGAGAKLDDLPGQPPRGDGLVAEVEARGWASVSSGNHSRARAAHTASSAGDPTEAGTSTTVAARLDCNAGPLARSRSPGSLQAGSAYWASTWRHGMTAMIMTNQRTALACSRVAPPSLSSHHSGPAMTPSQISFHATSNSRMGSMRSGYRRPISARTGIPRSMHSTVPAFSSHGP